MSTSRSCVRLLVLTILVPAVTVTACGAAPEDVSTTTVGSTESIGSIPVVSTDPEFQEPPTPGADGTGLPIDSDSTSVDCDNAEELCDSGEWVCDDFADYCDIGPDGGELPDELDWDS